ncbi:hypothetical protein GCM10010259_10110 [Streptomyces daghestanicus]|uniref:Uncharacterized protein n=1 Tax=Streptomyces daghestanicus TaxID=66885 RepID=A0ABQ3Q2B6_9ACTN|nr:hypothetical protein GCM10010259_10110 [Streptomyces daghestanicus]GHI31433.1 hypothetical protein Sdagh_31630 [Streptomyces daghestanicus]
MGHGPSARLTAARPHTTRAAAANGIPSTDATRTGAAGLGAWIMRATAHVEADVADSGVEEDQVAGRSSERGTRRPAPNRA